MQTQFKNQPQPDQYLISNPSKTLNKLSQIIPLSSQQINIGRTHQNNIQILDNTISKKHAKIQLLKGSYYLYDNGSANGVFVNGQKINGNVKLEDGDSIQFGKYQCLYKFVDKNSSNRNKSKGKGKINLKDYLFEENGPQDPKMKTNAMGFKNLQKQDSLIGDQSMNRKKAKPKQSKIRIPDLSDYLKLTLSNEPVSNKNQQQNQQQQKYTRSRVNKQATLGIPKQGKIKLNSMEQQVPTNEDLKQFRLDKREKNLYAQQQQVLQSLERQKRRIEQQKLKKQLEQAKISQDLLQKQLILQQKVREEQEKVQREKQKLEEEFIRREQMKRQEEMRKIQQLEEKQKEMMAKIQEERMRQLEELKVKQQTFKKQSQNQYKTEYEKRKRQLQLEAEALAQQYQNIYRETIRKVRTQIDNEENTIHKMQQTQEKLKQQSSTLDQEIEELKNQMNKVKNVFIQVNGRNKASILYASDIQDKIDALGTKEFREKQEGYYKSTAGFNQVQKSGAAKKLEEAVLNSRKLLKIKEKQYENIMEEITALSATIKQREYSSSSDVGDFMDTVTQNLQMIEKLKEEYLELIESERAVEQVWDAQLQENTELENRNKVLQNQIVKNIREIDENSRDQIKKSTEQRLHMLKVMHFCPQQKKNAARFLIQEMLNIEQEIHKFRMQNEETHKKIGKIISQTEKMKRQNQYLSEILFSQDENGHHFDNMKVVITSLMEKIASEKNVDNISDCLQMTRDANKIELVIQNQLERKKNLRENMRKIGQMGLAPSQMKINEKNPLNFFGDLLTSKQIQIQKRKNSITLLQNETNGLKSEIKLLQEKKSKISQALQKYKLEQLSEAKKYLGKN